MKKILNYVLTVAIIAFAIYQYTKYRVAPKVKLEKLELVDLNGNHFDVNALGGKPVFINFFATWCGPCNQEMPALEMMKQKFGTDVIFLAISDEDMGRIRSFQNRYHSTFLFLQLQQKTLGNLGIRTIPTSYLLNSSGEIVYKHVGPDDWESEAFIENLRSHL